MRSMARLWRLERLRTKQSRMKSGTNKEHKPKLLSPDIFRWGGGLPREGGGGGAKKFGMPLETRKSNFFGWISRDFAGISRGHPKSLRKTNLRSILFPYEEKRKQLEVCVRFLS